MDGIAVIDADTHLTEPHDLWTSRAPNEWVDRVPQVQEVKGRAMWTIDGEVFGNAVGAAGRSCPTAPSRSAPGSCSSGSTTCTRARRSSRHGSR